ncbi:MAG: endolytic transglycosylase MltG [Candidatus Dormibacteria bacterium]
MRSGTERGGIGCGFAVIGLLVVLAVAGGGAFAYGHQQLVAPSPTHDRTQRVSITEGETTDQLADDLAAKGLVRSAFWFRVYARVKRVSGNLQTGTFELDDGMGASAILARVGGSPEQGSHRVVLAEGLTAAQMAAKVEAAGTGITAADYLHEVRDGQFSAPFLGGRPPGASLDGFLFPDTYEVPARSGAHALVQQQLDDFARHGAPALQGSTGGLSTYQLVILASVVEREARFDADRPKVAGVIANRLAANMLLQVDASVDFGLGVTGREPTAAEKLEDTPYNTYLHAGLPPTPISNPGRASLLAAAHPTPSAFLFYVSDACGHNHYAVSNAEHERNVAKYVGTPCPA